MYRKGKKKEKKRREGRGERKGGERRGKGERRGRTGGKKTCRERWFWGAAGKGGDEERGNPGKGGKKKEGLGEGKDSRKAEGGLARTNFVLEDNNRRK